MNWTNFNGESSMCNKIKVAQVFTSQVYLKLIKLYGATMFMLHLSRICDWNDRYKVTQLHQIIMNFSLLLIVQINNNFFA